MPRSKVSAKSRMFHSIVLMGSGLSLGCGGVAKLDGTAASGSATDAGSSSTSLGGSGGLSAGGSRSDLIILPAAGSPSSGGALGVGGTLGSAGDVSGAAATGGFVSPLPCSPAQWSCAPTEVSCPPFDGFQLGTGKDCKCDPARPASAARCGPGYTFICMAAERDAQGNRFPQPIPYGCMCQPTLGANPNQCYDLCNRAFQIPSIDCYVTEPDASVQDATVLCQCATIILK
jgi:hypothetical protein